MGSLGLNPQDFVQGFHQLLVGMAEGFQVHNGPLSLPGGVNGPCFQQVGVLPEEVVGHLRDRVLGGGGLPGVLQSQGQNHLALPEGDGVDQAGLNLFNHQGVVILQHPGLGPHLQGDHPGQLQVVELFLKAVAQADHVVVRLGIRLGPAGGGLLLELGQVLPLNLGQALFPGQDVHGQLLLILGVQLKHLVQVGHVLHQGDLVGLQVFHNLIHVGGGFGVPGFQGGQLILFPAEKAGKAFFLLLWVKFLQLPDQVGQGLSDLPQVLGADLLQGVFGKLGDIFLGGGAVLEDHVAVGDVNGPGKVLHSFPLGWGELGLVQVALRQMRL